MVKFKDLGLSDEILKVLNKMGFETPTEIQAEAIPQLITGEQDFIGLAQTGTGKTAAFGLPLLERLDPQSKHTQALVLAPTRELGQQIAGQLHEFSQFLPKINVLAVYGGAAISNQMKALRKPQHVIIATPGRLIDLIKRKAIFLDHLETLVLDEADEMLNMGFKKEIDKILSYTPEDKLTWLFSATMPNEIKKIVNKYMDNPIEVKIDVKNKVNPDIKHQYIHVKRSDKVEALTRFIDLDPFMRAVVFCRTKAGTQELAEDLLKRNYKADAIHGDLSQRQRDRVMGRFKSNDLQLLIATDVAARGIDVNDLTHVFHFQLPDDESYYTHRSGRTARAGKKGISISFINGREGHKIRKLERELKIKFENILIPKSEDISSLRVEAWCQNILKTKTKGKIDPRIAEKVNTLFAELSKEELTAKLLLNELQKLNLDVSKDLNISEGKNDRDKKWSKREGGGGKDKRSKGRSGFRGKKKDKKDRDRDHKKSKPRGKKKKY